MKTNRTQPLKRTLWLLAALAVSLTLSIVVTTSPQAKPMEGCTGAYGWPLKPFDEQHQVRAALGDPRTIFRGPPTLETLVSGTGTFSFHQGIDITAPNGAAIYPVATGTVSQVSRDHITVTCDNGRAFEYWHMNRAVKAGQSVVAGKTVLGKVHSGTSHLHLTALEHGRPVDPLAPGRLTPYKDTTTPQVLGIAIRTSEQGPNAMPEFVRGQVFLLTEAFDTAEPIDTPGLRTPGIYRNWHVTPAKISWRIQQWNGKVVVRRHVSWSAERQLPKNSRFFDTYARGTYQNQSVFGQHFSYLQPGRFVFKLIARPFDTHTLHDGVYDLVVTAEDLAGHRDTATLRFTVHNAPGWGGS